MSIGREESSGTDTAAAAIAAAARTGGGRMLALLAAVLVVLAATAVAAAGHGDPARDADDGAARAAMAETRDASDAPGAIVYYGRARMPFVRRPSVSSRSSHPEARSPGRCTSRSLPSA